MIELYFSFIEFFSFRNFIVFLQEAETKLNLNELGIIGLKKEFFSIEIIQIKNMFATWYVEINNKLRISITLLKQLAGSYVIRHKYI